MLKSAYGSSNRLAFFLSSIVLVVYPEATKKTGTKHPKAKNISLGHTVWLKITKHNPIAFAMSIYVSLDPFVEKVSNAPLSIVWL